jgi:transposase InsO family protein
MIKKLRLNYTIPFMCHMLDVSPSGYYSWSSRPPSQHAQEEARLAVEIKAAHTRNRQVAGSETIQRDLSEHGIKVGICRIRKIRKKLGISCKQVKKFKATTDSKHKLPVADNLLQQRFTTEVPNQVWVSDITYIPTDEGWLYCAAHKDLFNGEIVGYALGSRITRELVIASLLMAVKRKRPLPGLVNHSDRGSQYCSSEYQRLLNMFHMKSSMSRKGNCYDNAPMESFWGTMKNELVYHSRYATREQAIREITEYIEIFYNRQRRQKRLGYVSPAVYVQRFYERKKVA